MAKFKHKNDPFADREAQKYSQPIPSREYILEYLGERGRPATFEEIQRDLELDHEDEIEALRRRLIAMVRDGQLLKNRREAYGPLDKMELIAGRVIGHKDGFGFVVPDQGGNDLFLSPRQMRNVFHGDRVLTRVSTIDTRGRREAIIVEVIERNTQQLVGRLFLESGAAWVEPTNARISQEILIPQDGLNDAKHGQMVVVAIVSQPTTRSRPIGQIVEILGDHMAPGLEITVAIRNHELPHTWPEEVSEEAAKFPGQVDEAAYNNRTDLRKLPFVTIDGEDAKDFDDAVYCEARKKGGWLLYVAIADVSHYVKAGSALDKEAYKRGNSVYFPGRVIPMLPESLSNNLCSLMPNVDRLALVCEMSLSPSGRILRHRFMEAVINSHARLTYTQVHAMIEKNDARVKERFKSVLPHVKELYALFHVLHKAREERGAIDFDMPETRIIFGGNRKIEKIVPYERFNSHRVIEECMLCANISAAHFLQKNELPGLYRVHEGPKEEKLNDLRRFLQELGLKLGTRDPTPADYSQILRATRDRPDAHMIQTVLLRSMSQAVYSPDNKGHFGLAYDAYAHYTSPIRRYPDLLVHRAIKQILHRQKIIPDFSTFVRAGEHCSMTERRADDATDEVTDWLKCEFMLDKVGLEFQGVISGVTNFGIFVELIEIYVEGLAHISTLPSDYYQFDPLKHSLYGSRSGVRYRLGDKVKVRVARVDLDQRQIDFLVVGEHVPTEFKVEVHTKKQPRQGMKRQANKGNKGNNKGNKGSKNTQPNRARASKVKKHKKDHGGMKKAPRKRR